MTVTRFTLVISLITTTSTRLLPPVWGSLLHCSTYRPSSSVSGGGDDGSADLVFGLVGFGFSATWWTAKTTALSCELGGLW